jgi:hypothetical protein
MQLTGSEIHFKTGQQIGISAASICGGVSQALGAIGRRKLSPFLSELTVRRVLDQNTAAQTHIGTKLDSQTTIRLDFKGRDARWLCFKFGTMVGLQ